jgi:hypothetical protein
MPGYIRNTIVLFLLLLCGGAYGQSLTVETRLDTNLILIGDQIRFHVEVEQQRDMKVTLPLFGDTITEKIEVLEASQPDTLFLSNEIIRVSQHYLITSFDSGLYIIPPQRFAFSYHGMGDTLESQALFLGVLTFKIDSIKGIADIKPPMKAPLSFREILPWILGGLAVVAIVVAGIWYYRRRKKIIPEMVTRVKPVVPPHITALNALDDLKRKKLWQQGNTKAYYSELSDIIRTYIEGRFEIIAMEQTTDETLDALEAGKYLPETLFENLKGMLSLADLVKFAKYEPLADQNELVFQHGYDMVLQTKVKVDLTTKTGDKIESVQTDIESDLIEKERIEMNSSKNHT